MEELALLIPEILSGWGEAATVDLTAGEAASAAGASSAASVGAAGGAETVAGSTADATTPGMASALSAGGSLASGVMSRNFQQQMSNTSYQRAVADLKAAGLNPMLAYSQGGASTPNWNMPNLGDAVHTGASASLAEKQQQLLDAQIHKTNEDAFLSHEEGRMYEAKANAEIGQRGSSAAQMDTQRNLMLDQYDSLVRKVYAELESEVARGRLTQVQADHEWAKMGLTQSHAGLNTWTAAEIASRIRKIDFEAQTLGLRIPREEAESGFHASLYGAARPYIREIPRVISSARSLMGIFGR